MSLSFAAGGGGSFGAEDGGSPNLVDRDFEELWKSYRNKNYRIFFVRTHGRIDSPQNLKKSASAGIRTVEPGNIKVPKNTIVFQTADLGDYIYFDYALLFYQYFQNPLIELTLRILQSEWGGSGEHISEKNPNLDMLLGFRLIKVFFPGEYTPNKILQCLEDEFEDENKSINWMPSFPNKEIFLEKKIGVSLYDPNEEENNRFNLFYPTANKEDIQKKLKKIEYSEEDPENTYEEKIKEAQKLGDYNTGILYTNSKNNYGGRGDPQFDWNMFLGEGVRQNIIINKISEKYPNTINYIFFSNCSVVEKKPKDSPFQLLKNSPFQFLKSLFSKKSSELQVNYSKIARQLGTASFYELPTKKPFTPPKIQSNYANFLLSQLEKDEIPEDQKGILSFINFYSPTESVTIEFHKIYKINSLYEILFEALNIPADDLRRFNTVLYLSAADIVAASGSAEGVKEGIYLDPDIDIEQLYKNYPDLENSEEYKFIYRIFGSLREKKAFQKNKLNEIPIDKEKKIFELEHIPNNENKHYSMKQLFNSSASSGSAASSQNVEPLIEKIKYSNSPYKYMYLSPKLQVIKESKKPLIKIPEGTAIIRKLYKSINGTRKRLNFIVNKGKKFGGRRTFHKFTKSKSKKTKKVRKQ